MQDLSSGTEEVQMMQYTSETIGELSAALAKAQGEMQNAPLNKTNPHFKSKYADLAAIRDAVTPALSKHGLTVTQMTGVDDNGQFVLFTCLSHSSGEWLKGVYPLPLDPSKPQQMGSAITYARRYTLAAMVGIAADEDDDANAAQTNGQQQPAKTYGGTAKRGDNQREPVPKANPQDFASPNVAAGENPNDSALVREVFRLCVDSAPDTDTLKAWWDEHQHAYEVLTDEDKKRVNAVFKKRKQALTANEKEAA